MNFSVSVIIPVYNAAAFVREAVESVVAIEEVREVLLIEDKSPDNALAICNELSREYEKVKVYQHPNGENRGAGASRNLGIEKAASEYVAFLDADDLCLENRFQAARSIFETTPDADGVYDPIGYYDDGVDYRKKFKLFGISKSIHPEKLFHYLLRGTYGHFHTNGIVIKKSLFAKSGLFDTSLRLHQDSELWLRMAFHGKLFCGQFQRPVAMARRHQQNRIAHAGAVSKLQFWSIVKQYYSNQPVKFIDQLLIFYKYIQAKSRIPFE